MVPYYRNSSEADTDPVKRDTREFGRPCLAARRRKCTRQRSRRDDLAGCEWWIDLIERENIDEMTTVPTQVHPTHSWRDCDRRPCHRASDRFRRSKASDPNLRCALRLDGISKHLLAKRTSRPADVRQRL